jgi:hypothetical protein
VTRIATLKAAGLSAEQILAVLEVKEAEEAEHLLEYINWVQ